MSVHERATPGGEVQEGRTTRVRTVLLGGSLVLAPAFVLAGELVMPSTDWEDSSEVVATAVAESTRWQLGSVLSLLGFMLLVPAVIAAAELVRRRKPGLALATVILVGAGTMSVIGSVAVSSTYAAARAADATQIASYVDEMEELGAFAVLFPMFFLAPIGVLVLAFGLWRTRSAPVWAAAALVVGVVLTFADPGTVPAVGWFLMTAGFAGVAWRYLAPTRAELDLRTARGSAAGATTRAVPST